MYVRQNLHILNAHSASIWTSIGRTYHVHMDGSCWYTLMSNSRTYLVHMDRHCRCSVTSTVRTLDIHWTTF